MAGVSEEDPHNVEDCGLEGAEAAKVSAGYLANYNAAFASIVAKGGFASQAMGNWGRNMTNPARNCQADMTRICMINNKTGKPYMFEGTGLVEFSRVDDGKNLGHAAPPWFPNGSLPYFEQDLATFLLGRGPYVWLGFGWSGCTDSHPPLPLGW